MLVLGELLYGLSGLVWRLAECFEWLPDYLVDNAASLTS